MPIAPPHYTDVLGGRLPALERCLIRYRALQVTVAIFHAEELKRDVINAAETMAGYRKLVSDTAYMGTDEKRPKNRLKAAFRQLISDGLLNADDKCHMVDLIGSRNAMAHQLHELSADLNPDSFARDHVALMSKRPKHDYEVIDKLKAARKLLHERIVQHNYITSIRFNDVLFSPIERAISSDLNSLDKRIRRLIRKRKADIAELNAELSLVDTDLRDEHHPRHPYNRYANGRLTERGAEICYRLYDFGKSPHAVAHLMGLTVASARTRQKKWKQLGGSDRTKK